MDFFTLLSIPICSGQTSEELRLQPLNPAQHWSHWRPWEHPNPAQRSQEVNLPPPASGSGPLEVVTPQPAEGSTSPGIPGDRSALTCLGIWFFEGCQASTCSGIHQSRGPRRSVCLNLPRDPILRRLTCLNLPKESISRRFPCLNLPRDLHPDPGMGAQGTQAGYPDLALRLPQYWVG